MGLTSATRVIMVCALALSASAFDDAAAQAVPEAKLRLDVSPFVGNGWQGTGLVPAGESSAVLDTHTVLGLAGELSRDGFPLRLRVSGSRTLGVNVLRMDGQRSGPDWSLMSQNEVGSASVTSLWADVVVSPFSWNVAPYGFVGLAKRWIDYHDATPGILRPRGSSLQRYGLGVDMRFNFARRSSFWIEAAEQGAARVLGAEAHEVLKYGQLTAGIRLPLF